MNESVNACTNKYINIYKYVNKTTDTHTYMAIYINVYARNLICKYINVQNINTQIDIFTDMHK